MFNSSTLLHIVMRYITISSTTCFLCYLGFLFFDMLYVAVVINYCTQCQLLHYYVSSIKDKVVNKAYLLGDAVKVSYHIIREIVKYSSLEASNYYIFPPHH